MVLILGIDYNNFLKAQSKNTGHLSYLFDDKKIYMDTFGLFN